MKKLALLALVSLSIYAPVFAQKDAEAKAILSQVSQKYKAYDAVKSDFTFTLDNPSAGIKETQTGTLLARSKANKFKVTLFGKDASGKPAVAQEIMSDSKTQWTFLKKTNEVQVNAVDNSNNEALNPAHIFTIYEHGYKYLYTGDQKVSGVTYQIVDLTPEDANKVFFKIRLMIDKVKKQLYSALIFDKNGTKYNYTITSFAPNFKVADNAFAFDAKTHPGVEVVDLR